MGIYAKKSNCSGDVTFTETPDGFYVCTIWSEKCVLVMDLDHVKKCVKELEKLGGKFLEDIIS